MNGVVKITSLIRKEIKDNGFYISSFQQGDNIRDIISEFGTVIQEMDIIPSNRNTSLVNSYRALDMHTDHHRAEFIAWYCEEQAGMGGDTLLWDTRNTLMQLTREELHILQTIRLYEHKVFPDDPESRPMLRYQNEKPSLYYSFWLIRKTLTPNQHSVLEKFQQLMLNTEPVVIRLVPGDILIIDNHRILHGRTSIAPNQTRKLVRYWISSRRPSEKKVNNMSLPSLIVPAPISASRIKELESKGIMPLIAAIDLEMVKMKLRDAEEGKGWTQEQCDSAELEYKRFLHLNKNFRDEAIVPNKIMDSMWHFHILDTRSYVKDSDEVFGGYFHHFPYFGMRGEEDKQNLLNSFEKTKFLYFQEFGEEMVRDEYTDCWHDCEGRCWHACSEIDKIS